MNLGDLLCRWFPWLCPKPKPIPDPIPPSGDINKEFLVLINQLRTSQGLHTVSIDSKLVGIAQSWSDTQARNNTLSHGDFQSRISPIYPNVYAAENVAEGSDTVQGTFNQWVNSPAHYENMTGNYTYIGLGRSISNSGMNYWTLDLVRN
jgi:uncharacterized protein YkwD